MKRKKFTAIWKKTFKGRYLEPGKKEIFLSRIIADKLNIGPGDNIDFSSGMDSPPVGLTVSGVYKTGMDQFDRGVSFCTMSAMPAVSGSWNAAIFLDNGIDMELIIAKYRNTELINNISFKKWSDLMPDLQQLIELNYISMSIVIILVFIVISFGDCMCFFYFYIKKFKSIRNYEGHGGNSCGNRFFLFFQR